MGFREDRPQDTGSKCHDEGVQRVMGTRKRRADPEHFQRMYKHEAGYLSLDLPLEFGLSDFLMGWESSHWFITAECAKALKHGDDPGRDFGLVRMQSGWGPGRLGGGPGRGVVAEEEGKGRDPLSLLDQVQAPRAGPFLPGPYPSLCPLVSF